MFQKQNSSIIGSVTLFVTTILIVLGKHLLQPEAWTLVVGSITAFFLLLLIAGAAASDWGRSVSWKKLRRQFIKRTAYSLGVRCTLNHSDGTSVEGDIIDDKPNP